MSILRLEEIFFFYFFLLKIFRLDFVDLAKLIQNTYIFLEIKNSIRYMKFKQVKFVQS